MHGNDVNCRDTSASLTATGVLWPPVPVASHISRLQCLLGRSNTFSLRLKGLLSFQMCILKVDCLVLFVYRASPLLEFMENTVQPELGNPDFCAVGTLEGRLCGHLGISMQRERGPIRVSAAPQLGRLIQEAVRARGHAVCRVPQTP